MSIELSGEYHKDVNILLDEISRILEDRTEQLIVELGRSTRANEEISNLKNENKSLRVEADQLHHECARFKKNHERYCWLRDMHIGDDPESINLDIAERSGLDAAIDSAMDD